MARTSVLSFVVDNYRDFLNVSYPSHVKPFRKRLASQPASARAEAVVYSFLNAHCDQVRMEEDNASGGVDFRCQTQGITYVVEVTHLDAEVVTRESGLPNDTPQKTRDGGHYGMIHSRLFHKVISKASQMSDCSCPRLLVITSEHVQADTVMGISAASELLTGETKIAIPSTELVSQLESSVFFRIEDKTLAPCHRTISAILLGSISRNSVSFVGLLHPDPVFPFPIKLLSSVPFVGLKSYTPDHGILHTKVYQEQPHGLGFIFYHPTP